MTSRLSEHLQEYGPIAVELELLNQRVIDASGNRDEWEAALTSYTDYTKDHPKAVDIIKDLATAKSSQVREFAASLIISLWQYWKVLPQGSSTRREYEKRLQNCARELSWTISYIESFITGTAIQPKETALYAIWEMDNITEDELVRLRRAVLTILDCPSKRIRFALVRTLREYYPSNDEARSILDQRALQFYVDCTYDTTESIRDAACFELWLGVENLNDAVGRAFLDAIERESHTSEVYIEAIVGAARMGIEQDHIDSLVRDQLATDDFGVGWIDAVEQGKTQAGLQSLVAAYERLLKADESDSRLDKIEAVLEDWNEL